MRALTFSVLRRCKARLWRPRSAVEGSAPAPRMLCTQPEPAVTAGVQSLVEVHPSWPEGEQAELRAAALRGMRVLPGFISEEEETALLAELEPVLKRMRYEFDHWDNAIQGYRETERSTWSVGNQAVLGRVRAAAFPEGGRDAELLPSAHVLDLAAAGHIRPHIDAVRTSRYTSASSGEFTRDSLIDGAGARIEPMHAAAGYTNQLHTDH
ncbi:hypothetical protein MSG28_005480 [Choristoneura fumiferana]|uniref:Uncharacterized protein n=1 Tax=Choristoneura fumiferana TaxID=7141 RepID=A0ACC0L092_CHOFU|nr:hypothetical protein MSG28_005480 [Choristoneura fumiferana]